MNWSERADSSWLIADRKLQKETTGSRAETRGRREQLKNMKTQKRAIGVNPLTLFVYSRPFSAPPRLCASDCSVLLFFPISYEP
jgi:hypothetical protein